MFLNVVRTDFDLNLYSREQSAHYFLVALPAEQGIYNPSVEVVGTIEVEEILSIGPTGVIETVKINNRKYYFVGVNPFANKVVFDDGNGQGTVVSF